MVISNADIPRSVVIETSNDTIRRNSTMLFPVAPSTPESSPTKIPSAQNSKSMSPV